MRDVKRHKVKPRTATDGRRVDALLLSLELSNLFCVVPLVGDDEAVSSNGLNGERLKHTCSLSVYHAK